MQILNWLLQTAPISKRKVQCYSVPCWPVWLSLTRQWQAIHALAYPIGGAFHVPHGLSNALVLPHVLRFNAPEAAQEYAELAPFVFPDIDTTQNSQEVCAEFIERLAVLSATVGLQQKLREVSITRDDLPSMARDAMKQTRLLVNNPRKITEQDALAIYQAAW